MFRKSIWMLSTALVFLIHSPAQTTNGLITGTITDSSGAVIVGAQVDVTDQVTRVLRSATSGNDGNYIFPQLPPGVYNISVKKQGFTTEERTNIRLEVNQSATLDFKIGVSSTSQTVQVTGAPAMLNTTSATLGDVIAHDAVVDLPLNGRQFTQLALLTPGATPVQDSQQGSFTVSLGAGGISPSVNGQRGEQNNYTMDGLLNNSLFTNIWAISPPPDALQEFNVQSHITDAQFSISSGANINIVTRSGTNAFHGSTWEFIRNTVLDSKTFPATVNLPYHQNQYGVFLGGPVLLPHWNGKDNTWFAGYWEGFRSDQTLSYLSSTFTTAETTGDFSALLGARVGTDSLGRPEYQNEIYDPATSQPDPTNPAAVIRNPFPGNIIPAGRINPAATAIFTKYYPAPNLNVAATVLPNYQFSGGTDIASDVAGIRVDHRFRNNDILYGRFNRANANRSVPESLPGYVNTLNNYSESRALSYTHLFGTTTILNLRYGWTKSSVSTTDTPAGTAFASSFNFLYGVEPDGLDVTYGPGISISNGYSGVSQTLQDLGPQKGSDYHIDLSKVIGRHTIGVGGMFYRLSSDTASYSSTTSFTQNATSQGATSGSTGNGAASFMLGLLDNISAYAGNTREYMTANWYGAYVQDQWKALKKMTLTAGLRYDFVAPPNPHRILSGLDIYTGQFNVNQPVPPLFPKATVPANYFYPQYDGYEPRFGVAYQASSRTVIRSAFAVLDDHNNTLVQESQNGKKAWPDAVLASILLLNRSQPTVFENNLPSLSPYLNPLEPAASQAADPHARIPYSMEYNAGIQQQLSNSVVMNLDYVGSLGRHQYMQPTVNTATIPGPGSLASRGQPYPQYAGATFAFETNVGNASYNALQAELRKTMSSGLAFMASYTWSKSMDLQSDPYTGATQNFYNLGADWGPSDYHEPQVFVFSGVYELPFGAGKPFLSGSNRVVQTLFTNWNVGSIISLHSGQPFSCLAGGDIANVGGGTQRCDKIGNPYAGPGFQKSPRSWVNRASFETITYTYGTEGRNDLRGPSYKDVDFSIFKDFVLHENTRLEFRGEFFNLFNRTNYLNPTNSIQSSAFGKILTSNFGREIQFAAKLTF
jgi:hypothetical protein